MIKLKKYFYIDMSTSLCDQFFWCWFLSFLFETQPASNKKKQDHTFSLP